MSIVDFIRRYYIDPMVQNQGYNLVSTLTYSLLAVLAAYLTYKLLEKFKIKINGDFVVPIIILVVFGTMVRLLEEANIVVSYFLVTPAIWIEMFVFIFSLFLISKFAEKRFGIPYYKTLTVVGILLASIPMVMVLGKITQFRGMFITLGLLIPSTIILYLIRWKLENKLVVMAHVFDATATFTAVQFFGFTELYQVPRFLITTFSPIAFVIIKILVVGSILILIDKYSTDKNFNNFLKLTIAILGLGPALRDFFIVGFS